MRKNKSLAVPPGWTIKEQMELHHYSVDDLAKHLNLDLQKTEALLNGELEIDYPLADTLQNVFGIPSQFWQNLEINYRNAQYKWREK